MIGAPGGLVIDLPEPRTEFTHHRAHTGRRIHRRAHHLVGNRAQKQIAPLATHISDAEYRLARQSLLNSEGVTQHFFRHCVTWRIGSHADTRGRVDVKVLDGR